jgi:soluble lytic murein transglycosylase-like protein
VGGTLKRALAALALSWPAAALAGPGDRWAAEIADASSRFGVPEEWIRRVIRAESNGQTLLGGRPIVSRAGAMGLMQLMPGTWRDMRLALGLGPDPHDPADNIVAGTFYLRLMYERFGYPGMFAAYNAGPARYSAYLTGRRGLPAETSAYVAAVARPDSAPTPQRVTVATIAATLPAKPPPVAPATLRQASGGLFVALESAIRR